MKLLKIGIVGCGAIGSSLAKIINRNFFQQAFVSCLYDIDFSKIEALRKKIKPSPLSAKDLKELIKKSDLVIECASKEVSFNVAKKVLLSGKDVLIMSVGGILKGFNTLTKLAKEKRSRIYIPSGAICGIDALKAAKLGKIKNVILTTTKNPLAFKDVIYLKEKGIDILKIKQRKILFSGTAEEAVEYFPQNVNVAAVLSLAGIGAGETKVRIIADPKIKRNTHEVKIESEAGKILTRTENVLNPNNPKTSYLAILSAVATLKKIFEPISIGT